MNLITCFAYPALAARPKTDVIVMNNGDRITCEVKRLEGGILKVDVDYVDGTISIDWLKVARLESNYLFLVLLQDGSLYSGKVVNAASMAGTPLKLEIQSAVETVAIDKADVARITQTSDTFLKRWSGRLTVGASYAKGNDATQYNLGSEFDYQQTRWGARMGLNSNLSWNAGAAAATRNQIDLSAYRMLPRKNYFLAGTTGFLQSSVQEIQFQTLVGLGAGRYVKDTNHIRLAVQGGLGWQRTSYTPTAQLQRTQDIGVVVASSNLQVFSFKKTRLDLAGSLFPAATEPGRLFSRINASYYVKIFRKIDWNLSFYGNWDTQPPGSLPTSDYGSSTGLSYTFGNK